MKTAHPGCGGHAGSKGYNSGGHYCGGWAGNCGDGGVGGSSWYGFCVLNFLSILSNFLSPALVTQPMMQCRLNPKELRSMNSYVKILCRF